MLEQIYLPAQAYRLARPFDDEVEEGGAVVGKLRSIWRLEANQGLLKMALERIPEANSLLA